MLKKIYNHLEYQKKWRRENPKYRSEYYLSHKEQEKEKNMAWRKKNIERWNKYMKENFHSWHHPEHYKEWIANNREKKNWHTRRRRALRSLAGGTHLREEWEELKKRYNYTCPACGKCEPEIVLTEDHIVPLSKGGSDYIDNIQPLCKSCNSKKYTKIFQYNPSVLKQV